MTSSVRNLLFLSHRNPFPPTSGSQIKPFHMIRTLARRGHRVHLRCFAEARNPDVGLGQLRRWCDSVEVIPLGRASATIRSAFGLATGRCLTDSYFDDPGMRRSVGRLLEGAAVSHAIGYSSAVAQFIPPSLRSRSIMELADLDSAKFEQYSLARKAPWSWVYGVEARRLRRRELEIVAGFGLTTLVSRREWGLLRAWTGESLASRAIVMTNGVDVEYFAPSCFEVGSLPVGEVGNLSRAVGHPRLLFTGVMDYAPNVEAVQWFATVVFPEIQRRFPDAQFVVVGNRPSREVKRLADREGVVVTGFVEDVRPYLAWADCCVVPLKLARGIQNKALEAMAAGKAVVMSSGAHEGIAAEAGVHYLVADDVQAYLAALGRLAHDAGFAAQLGRHAREFVVQRHSWDTCLQPMVDFIEG